MAAKKKSKTPAKKKSAKPVARAAARKAAPKKSAKRAAPKPGAARKAIQKKVKAAAGSVGVVYADVRRTLSGGLIGRLLGSGD